MNQAPALGVENGRRQRSWRWRRSVARADTEQDRSGDTHQAQSPHPTGRGRSAATVGFSQRKIRCARGICQLSAFSAG